MSPESAIQAFREKPPRSVAWRVLASMALVSVIIFGAFTLLYSTWEHGERDRKLEGELDVLTDIMSASLVLPLWNVDWNEVSGVLRSTMRDDKVTEVVVTDLTSGTTVGLGRDAHWKVSPLAQATHFPRQITRTARISYGSTEIGMLSVSMTPKFLEKDLESFLLALFLAGSGLGVFQVALLYLGMRRIVLRPLAQVDEFALRVMRGSPDQTIEGVFSGELESLRLSIQGMVRALTTSEKKYRDIFENAVEGLFQSGVDGTIHNANPAMARILGYADTDEYMAQVVNARSQIYENAEDRDRLVEVLRQRGALSNFETRMRRKDGSLVWVAVHARAVLDQSGVLQALEGIIEDISKRKQAELELLGAMRFVGGIIDTMPSVVVALKSDGAVSRWNQQAAGRYGVDAAQAEGRPLSELLPSPAVALKLASKALETGEIQTERRVEETLRNETRLLDLLAWRVPTGNDPEAVIRIDDVTDQVRMEEIMIQTEKMMSLGGLTAGMAHEVNNPLGAIMLSAENLRRRLDLGRTINQTTAFECGLSVDSLRCYLERRKLMEMIDAIYESSRSASLTIRNMLEFSRKSQGGFETVDLVHLLDKALEIARQDYDLKKNYDFRRIEVERDYAPGLPGIPCKPQEIEQVVLNLLRNAAQAIFTTEAPDVHPLIRLRVVPESDFARIEITDNGPGMNDDVRRRVFEPFFTTKPVGVGTGLGLSVSFFIITKNHGGQFFVDSAPGKGATFTIRLPLVQPEEPTDHKDA